MQKKLFQKNIEGFICGNCGYQARGNGYTNHCPKCLWSKHVDVNPGDRAATCGGMMKPISMEIKNGEYIIIHKCKKCGFEKKNKTSPTDNFNKIVKISKNTRI